MPSPLLSPVARLDYLLRQAGYPIEGVSRDAVTGDIRIDFRPEATEPQRVAALAFAASFDLTPRQMRSESAIRGDVAGLPAIDRDHLTRELLVQQLLQNPLWAQVRGVSLVGDETVPVSVP